MNVHHQHFGYSEQKTSIANTQPFDNGLIQSSTSQLENCPQTMSTTNPYHHLIPLSSVQQPTIIHNDVIDELCRKFQQHSTEEHPNHLHNHQLAELGQMVHYAAMNNDIELMTNLLQYSQMNMEQLINSRDSELNTPLLIAASNGHREMVRLLLKNGASVNAQNFFHNTSLHEAAWNGFSETLEIILLFNYQSSNKQHLNSSNIEIATSDHNHQDNHNETITANKLSSTTLKLHLKNKQGHTALHLAAQKGHNQSTRVLLLAGCKPNVKNNFGDTPLHSASRYGHIGVVRILISAFANVNELNKNDDTALHIAAAMNRKKLAKILLENGCNPTIVNRQGETPMNIALRKSYFDIQELIASPPPLKTLGYNHRSYRSASISNSNKDLFGANNGLFDPYLLASKSDTIYSHYDLDIVKETKFHGKHRHRHRHYDYGHQECHRSSIKRCKSDFSNSNQQDAVCLMNHHFISRRTTPTTQASSNHDSRRKSKINKRKQNRRNEDSDDSSDSQSSPSSHNDYGNYHDGYHQAKHRSKQRNGSETLMIAKPKLNTLPREPLAKGEKYFMDLSGHIHKGPISTTNNNHRRSSNKQFI